MSKDLYQEPWGGHTLCGCCSGRSRSPIGAGSGGCWYCLCSCLFFAPMLHNTYKVPGIYAQGVLLTTLSIFYSVLLLSWALSLFWYSAHVAYTELVDAQSAMKVYGPLEGKDKHELGYKNFTLQHRLLCTILYMTSRWIPWVLLSCIASARCHIQDTRFQNQPFKEGYCKSCWIALCCSCCAIAQQMKFLNDETLMLAADGEENKPLVPAQDDSMV